MGFYRREEIKTIQPVFGRVKMENESRCPFCNSITLSDTRLPEKDSNFVVCKRCGKYILETTACMNSEIDKHTNGRAIISYWLRNHQYKDPTTLTTQSIKEVLQNIQLPSISEQIDNLLLYLGNHAVKPSALIEKSADEVTSLIGCVDEEDLFYHLKQLQYDGLISRFQELDNTEPLEWEYLGLIKAQITHKGWSKYYELLNSNKNSRLAFMAMKFGIEPLETIYSDVIKPAVDKTGFEIRKITENPSAGLIDDKLRVDIRRSKFLIADLSHDNNGAYWEAGFAEGLGMPVIYICEEKKFNDKTKTTHFDTNHHLTVLWKNEEAGLKKFAEDLKATIRATLPAEARMDD
ncbi:MAG: hypothetical protein WCZ90_11035 [Melioribacteraceae bacterium]